MDPPFLLILPTLFPGENAVKDSSAPLSPRASVGRDWRTWLPQEQEKVFRLRVQELESKLRDVEVSLNEALDLRRRSASGSLFKPFVFFRSLPFAHRSLSGLLRALHEHAKHYGSHSNAAPLDPANLRDKSARNPLA